MAEQKKKTQAQKAASSKSGKKPTSGKTTAKTPSKSVPVKPDSEGVRLD